MDPVLRAFLSDEFDLVFSRFATARWASMAAELDLPTLHTEARAGISKIIKAARNNADPGSRIIAISGEAGLGKTHCITSELAKYAGESEATPVLMQLAAEISKGEVSRWLLQMIFRELTANAFPDRTGRTPMQALAAGLWDHAKQEPADAYVAALEAGDDEEAERRAVEAAKQIVRNRELRGLSSDHLDLVAGILLRSDDRGYGFKAWINGSEIVQSIGPRSLEPIRRESQLKGLIIQLAQICFALQRPLVLVFDQIEAADAVGLPGLLVAMISYAIQLVDDSITGTAVIISALNDTLESAKPELKPALAQRLTSVPKPVILKSLTPQDRTDLIRRRGEVLLRRCDADISDSAIAQMAPAGIFEGKSLQRPREVLECVQDYREQCVAVGAFVTPMAGTGLPEPKPNPQGPSFDQLWQDKRDAAVGGIINLGDHQRLQLLKWYFETSATEISGLKATRCDPFELRGDVPIQGFTISFIAEDGTEFERWVTGYADAPITGGHLNDQIAGLLQSCRSAKPAIVLMGGVTGIQRDGMPDRSLARLRTLRTGPSLVSLIEAGGRLAPTGEDIWFNLSIAREFHTERKASPGFQDWQRERQFLTNEVDVGALSKLARPETDPVRFNETPTGGGMVDPNEGESVGETPERTAVQEGSQTRDTARILIGQDPNGNDVRWVLDRNASPALPNFGLTVSGDAGQGKTQVIKAIIGEVAAFDCPILIFDFKNDYTDDFAQTHGFKVIDLRNGVPFNPLLPAPTGAGGAQAIDHIFEVSSVLENTLGLGAQQVAQLRSAMEYCFESRGEPVREWRDVSEIKAPSMAEIVTRLSEEGAQLLINRLGLLHDLRLLPSQEEARLSFSELLSGRFVLSFNLLPNDDRLKAALAEMILIQLQGYMLRGDQPKVLRRLLVFDEAWRAAKSERLIQLAREGRAFGVGVVVGSQFPDDLSADLLGNLATKLYLYNSDAQKRQSTIRALLGSSSGAEASRLRDLLQSLQPFNGIFVNQQNSPYTQVKVLPYFER